MRKLHDKCYFCRGNLVKKKITMDYWWKGSLTLVENVPAWVCKQCGEEVFEGPVLEKIDQVVKGKAKARTVTVLVKKFNDLPLPASV